MKYFSVLLLLFFGFLFFGCDEAELMVEPVISSVETGEASSDVTAISRYTGVLYRVGDVERFGSGANNPVALEWNGTDFYMLAEHGFYQSAGQYFFRVDKELGTAQKVNPGARDLGGSFTQGRSFTQVRHVRPNDLAWSSDTNEMFASCLVLDMIVSIDVVSGFAGRLNWDKLSFCIEGYERVPQPYSLGYDGIDFYMASSGLNLLGEKIVMLSRLSGNFSCATQIAEILSFDQNAVRPTSMCWDGQGMYISESNSRSLSLLNLETGELHLVARWVYNGLPPGHYIQDKHTGKDSELTQMPADHDGKKYHYVNREKNAGFDFPDITGIAFDGQDMYAVDYFTDALYRVGRN